MSRSRESSARELRWRASLETAYGRFIEAVGVVLLLLLTLVTVVSILRLGRGAYSLVLSNAFATIEYKAFQTIFGMALTVFILLELLHAIVFQFLSRYEPQLLLRSFLLIALLALARKLLLIEVDANLLIAISIAILSLSASVWILGRSAWLLEDPPDSGERGGEAAAEAPGGS